MSVVRENTAPVRVVIVDDTRAIRALIRKQLAESPQIQVVGEAGDPYEARELIRALSPDVITLDIIMPRMDGLDFLERLMRLRPMPVVMVSTRTTEKSREAIKALSLGAVDCVDLAALQRGECAISLAKSVLLAASSNIAALNAVTSTASASRNGGSPFNWNGKVVVIGSSTGGVDALLKVLGDYPNTAPPTVIAQHMPASFLESFSRRLNKNSPANVALATDGAVLEPGKVYVAPGGGEHTILSPQDMYKIEQVPDDGSHSYVPSIDMLFSSAIDHAEQTVGVMLTGMGSDGAKAMLRMRQNGAHTIVQDKASSVIDGMPGSARALGAAIEVSGLNEIGARIVASAGK